MPKHITNLTYKIEEQATKAGFVYKLSSNYYKNIIEKEAVLANITADDHILCIGGGICPFSAILFHQTTGARVTVIDNNESCIPQAKCLIRRVGVESHVKVLHQCGCSNICFNDFTVVHLALQVTPIERVFENLQKQVKVGTRLLVRRPKKHLGGLYCQMCDNALTCRPYVTHKSRNVGNTALYIKQSNE
ncbi:MAG: hypothetical protein FWD97_01135 [Defluviitaleaceae bacterium]|nr:hypothetical protein [Defluviitaleaceae bacterium]